MAEQAGEISVQEKQTRNEMLFTLSERDRGTLAMAVTPNEWKRKEIYRFLKDHLKEYIFFDLDLTQHTYTSLYHALQELLPPDILQSEPVQYLVSVTGLENSLYKTEDGNVEFSSLVAQLNFERESIFNQSYIILLWISEGFDNELRRKAPDLMHWMSKRFVFEGDGQDGMTVAEDAIGYGVVNKQGKIPERLARIRQLEETWEKLCLYNEDKARLVRDKINLLLLLGKEYAAAFDLSKAIEALQKAISLDKKIDAGFGGTLLNEIGGIYHSFNMDKLALKYLQEALETAEKYPGMDKGYTYYMMGSSLWGLRRWEESKKFFQQALERYKEIEAGQSIGNTYHMIGMVEGEEGRWNEALKNYQQALDWYKRTGNDQRLGATYHQLGWVFQHQKKWDEALEYYRQSLEWKKKTGGEFEVGSTYHQIAMVYQEKGEWDTALQNFREALEWKKKTGNEYEIGYTYHQIGRLYEDHRQWIEALESYEQALEWKIKGGNEYELGSTYHQMGRIEEAKGQYAAALEYYQKAVDNQQQFNHPYLPISQESVKIIRQKLANQQPSAPHP